jgi:hypothetical protein
LTEPLDRECTDNAGLSTEVAHYTVAKGDHE